MNTDDLLIDLTGEIICNWRRRRDVDPASMVRLYVRVIPEVRLGMAVSNDFLLHGRRRPYVELHAKPSPVIDT